MAAPPPVRSPPGTSTAQVGSYVYLNQKAPHTNPSPAMLVASNVPKIGGALQLQVPYSWRQRNRSGQDFFLATGLKNPGVLVTPLGGWLFSSAEVIVPTPMSPLGIPGTVKLSLAIPNDVRLVGIRFFQQVLVTSPSLRLGRGGVGVIGR